MALTTWGQMSGITYLTSNTWYLMFCTGHLIHLKIDVNARLTFGIRDCRLQTKHARIEDEINDIGLNI